MPSSPTGKPVADASVAAELAAQLFAAAAPIVVGAAVACVSVAVLWDALPKVLLLAWGGAQLAASGVRFELWRRYHGRGDEAVADRPAARWLAGATGAAALSGILWGCLATAVAWAPSPSVDIFVAVVVAGMTASVASTYTAHVPLADAFNLPALVPLILATATRGDALHWGLAALETVFAVNLSVMVRRSHGAVVHTIEARVEKERLAQGLVAARNQAEAANRAKSQFLASMSHELRTPLNAILGFSEIIADEMLGPAGQPKYVEYARDLHASGRHLLDLIDDLLDIAKIDAGRLALADAPVDLREMIDAALRMEAPSAEARGVVLSAEVAPGLPRVRGDERRLKQVVLNLLSNSIKFTPAGGRVTLAAAVTAEGLAIAVTDSGIGIAAADIPTVLEPFGQVASAQARAAGKGTGLGLPLTKRLVELHGGRLTIASVPGEGTTVTVLLPKARLSKDAA